MTDEEDVRQSVKRRERFFGHPSIELGSGRSRCGYWLLLYIPDGGPPRDEHHITGPTVLLFSTKGGHGRPVIKVPPSGSLAHPHLCVYSLHPPEAHIFGEVDVGFDRVRVHCDDESIAEAVVIDCAEHLPFNYYVAEATSRVERVTATGPGGREASWQG
jgi:hypothetical protein